VGSWSWDVRTQEVVWSEETYRLLDTAPGTPLSFEMVLAMAPDPSVVANTQAQMARALAGEAPQPYESSIRCRDGSIRHFLNTYNLERDAEGKPARVTGVFQDITAAKQAEQEREELRRRVQHAQKLESLGLLAGGVAHDFNNLLVGILTNASLLLEDVPPSQPRLREPLEDIAQAGQRASELTRQLLAYSGRARFIIEPVNLSELAREMGQLLHAALHPGARLTLELSPELPAVHADATQLRQVVMNLITNAADALEGRAGEITVRTAPAAHARPLAQAVEFRDGAAPLGPAVVLDVSDTGVGMEPQTLQRIFDPFFTTKFTGRGLGLAAALGIVRGHKGSIAVASAKGRGSTFRLQFPAIEGAASAAGAQRKQGATRPERGERLVLVVDDDPAVGTVVERSLQRLGCKVVLAAGGTEALAMLRAGLAPDLVLLDLTMPTLSGRDVLATVAVERPELPVVLMSGYNESELLEVTTPRPAGFLSKPFTLDELDAVLRLARN
jgi:signal transduction histidine kinase